MPHLRQGHRPCSSCGKYASEWHDIDGTLWAVKPPYGVSVSEGESWTCAICVEKGRKQFAGAPEDPEDSPTL